VLSRVSFRYKVIAVAVGVMALSLAFLSFMNYRSTREYILANSREVGLGLMASLKRSVEAQYRLLLDKAVEGASMAAAELEGGKALVSDQKVRVGNVELPVLVVLKGGLVDLTGNMGIVEGWAKRMDARFTIFQVVEEGGRPVRMVRVSTNIRDRKGELILGTSVGEDDVVFKTTVLESSSYRGINWVESDPFVGAYVPVADDAGKIFAVVFCGFPLESLFRQVVDTSFGKDSYGFVFTSDGTTIAHPSIERGTKLESAAPDFFRAFREASASQEGVYEVRYLQEGRPKVAYLTRAGFGDFHLGASLFEDTLLEPVYRMRNGMALVAVPAALVAAVILMVVLSRLISPLMGATRVAGAIASGDLTVDVCADPNSTDEIQRVLCSFASIASSFKKLVFKIRGLEKLLSDSSDAMADIAQSIMLASQETFSAAGNMVSAIASISSAAEETNAGVEEIAAEAQRVAHTADEIKARADAMRREVDRGGSSVRELAEEIKEVGAASRQIGEAIDALERAVERIVGFVGTISSIADQTNLLALNAAIEAARAGEAGRGFAVVAEEVRKLAEQSNEAAKQVEVIISEIQGKTRDVASDIERTGKMVSEAVKAASDTADLIGKVVEEIESFLGSISRIVEAAESQSAGIQQIASAMDNIVKMVGEGRNAADLVEESSRGVLQKAEELLSIKEKQKRALEGLEKLVASYKVNGGSKGNGEERAIAPIS